MFRSLNESYRTIETTMDQREGLDAEAIADVLRKAMNLCSRQEKCACDMRVWFSRKGIPPECIEALVNTLISQNYIDDARYAEAYAREKTKLSQWGANRIAEMLRRKRIDERSIQRAVEAATAAYGKVNMEELMEKKARSEWRRHLGVPSALSAKLVRFAVGKGFGLQESIEAATRVVSKLRDEQAE